MAIGQCIPTLGDPLSDTMGNAVAVSFHHLLVALDVQKNPINLSSSSLVISIEMDRLTHQKIK